MYLEHEDSALTDQLPGQREDVLHLFLGENRPACCDPAEQRGLDGSRVRIVALFRDR